MKKIFRSFRGKLYTLFAFILLIPVITVGSLSYLSAKDSIKNEILFSANESVKILNTLIDDKLREKINDMTVFSEDLDSSKYEQQEKEILTNFHQYLARNPDVLSIYIGTNEGTMISEPEVHIADYNPLERDWYKEAVALKGETLITNPYMDAETGEMVVTIARQVKDQSGVMALDIKLTDLQKIANSIKIGKNGYSSIFGDNNLVISHPTLEAGKELNESFLNQMYDSESGTYDYVFDGDDRILFFTTEELTNWKVTGTIFAKEINQSASSILYKTLFVLIVAIVISSIVFFFVMKTIIKPIRSLKDSAVTISEGDLTEKVTITSHDEIGQLGQAFNDMQDSLRNLIQKVEQNAEEVASSADELTANANQTSTVTEKVAISIQDVASSADSQTTSADKNAESLLELSKAILHIAEISSTVTDLSQHATLQADEGGQAVQDTKDQMQSIHVSVTDSNTKIQSLHERSQQITSILDVITSIADQTNLLALNAAIEAARAGEHGKGFAVVADEVRKLAEQSQESAQQIFEIIQGIQLDTEQSVNTMAKVTEDVENGLYVSDEAIAKFQLIKASMDKITPKMEEVSSASEQMSASVQEVAAVTEDLAFSAKGNAAASEDVAASTEEQVASMEEINASAQALAHMADELKQLISQFKY
ncbi:chemotaxis protein [Lysinibacillus sphaericus]|uniref:HAMP domain-containing methyl-accepting chemotaxis protein n=1 Tax=Lysinibacillus sphaericus TaxID=1421 RepID=UPI0018CDBD1F|nr:methyl-accepting chemotaxis protein [Lysinibacillus sphaericus]MBG9455846.1 chemotaxis protein [Lysinibacillus sphaericus]MBG9479686.1 chemotaxis protein [Lysinibacillus sphaericus]MBG9594419.1 chemotaxis protein [Lysinibacillus sphaericus]